MGSLAQSFSVLNVHRVLGILTFRKSRAGLRSCIFQQFAGLVCAAGPWTTPESKSLVVPRLPDLMSRETVWGPP